VKRGDPGVSIAISPILGGMAHAMSLKQRCPVTAKRQRCERTALSFGCPHFLGKVKKGPLTYGPIGGEKRSWTPSTKKSMVPLVVSNRPTTYPNIDTYPLIY